MTTFLQTLRDCFNFSREYFNFSRKYFSLWVIKTSLDRNASAPPDPEVLFSRVARHLAGLAFCKLKVGIFQRSLPFIIFRGYWPMRFSIVTSRPHVVCLSSSLNKVFLVLVRHAIFPGSEMYKRIMAPRGTYLQTSRVLFSILSTKNYT